jgi:glucan phosphoethanolaminetransferase (alkaline phosphatase superfamily)
MQRLNERTVLIILLTVITIATLFCLIGLATPGWGGSSIFHTSTSSTAALSIISLLLLIACVAMAAIILTGVIQHEHLPSIFVTVLIISSIFILGTFASRIAYVYNYSYNLMVTSFTFTYLSSIFATYWLFGVRGSTDKTGAPAQQQQQQNPRLAMT